MDNDIPVQDGENNDSREQIPTHVSQERNRNEEKDSLANRKQESQSKVTKRKKKSRKRKVSTSVDDSDSCQLTLLHQQERKRNPNVDDIINLHRHLPQLPTIQVLMRNRIMTGLKLSEKTRNLNGNYPKVRPTTQTNILISTFQRLV